MQRVGNELYSDFQQSRGSVLVQGSTVLFSVNPVIFFFFPHTFSLFIVCLDLVRDGFCFSVFVFFPDMFYFYMVRSDSFFLYGFLIWVTVFPISRLLKKTNYLMFSSFRLWFHFFHLNLWPISDESWPIGVTYSHKILHMSRYLTFWCNYIWNLLILNSGSLNISKVFIPEY